MRRGLLIGGIGAVALLVLSLVQAAALLPSCGLRLGTLGSIDFCGDPAPAGPSPELAAALERRDALEDRIRGLERDLAGLDACPPPIPPAPEPEPDPDQLDADRWNDRDISLLEGCWSLASDYELQDSRTGEVVTVESWKMCFDAEGRGDQQLAQTDGTMCEGEVTASFADDGQLRIGDQADVQCTEGYYIFRRVMTCTLEPNGEAACRSRQPDRGEGSTSVRIVRRETA